MQNKNLIALWTIFRKEMVRVFRIWPQTLLPPVITMALYFVIFGKVMGDKIGVMQGVTYIEYIIPGLIMMALITNSYANVTSSFFGSKFQKNIEELLIAPISNTTIIWGYLSGGICRGLIVGIFVAIVASFFVTLKIYSFTATIIIALLTAILFSLAGLINGIFAKKFDDISIIPTFILTPLIYLGGVFYTIKLLPGFLQKATLFNPIFYMVNGFRYCLLGKADISLMRASVVLSLFCIVLYLFTYFLLRKGIGIKN